MWRTEVKLAGHGLENPIVYLPMGLGGWDNPEGLVGPKRLEHYGAVARGGAGMIIVEATLVAQAPPRRYPVMPGVLAAFSMLGLYEDRQMAGMRELAAVCGEQGALALIQLTHPGCDAPLDDRLLSDWSAEEMARVQQAFVASGQRAQAAGFAGVELHGAHGQFLSQVLSPVTNDRTDTYGGSGEKRAAYVTDIIEGIKAACGADFIVGVRMGCNEPNLAGSLETARMLASGGADFLDISAGLSSSYYAGLGILEDFPYSRKVYGAWQIHQQVNVPVIAVEGITTGEQALDILRSDYAQLVGVGRAMLADPDWPRKVMAGAAPVPCRHCRRCHWYSDPERCPARLERKERGECLENAEG